MHSDQKMKPSSVDGQLDEEKESRGRKVRKKPEKS
jgi:hypothetical protein